MAAAVSSLLPLSLWGTADEMDARWVDSSRGTRTPGNSETSCFLKGLMNIVRGILVLGDVVGLGAKGGHLALWSRRSL